MNGIEKITAKISQDAAEEISKLDEQTAAQISEIEAQAQAQAEKIRADLDARGRRAADERRERLKSAAGMERRKLELGAKQRVLGEAFDLALEKLCSLPDEQYGPLLTALVLESVSTGSEKIIFSENDRKRIGSQVVTAANEALLSRKVPTLPENIKDSKIGAFLNKVVNSAAAQLTGTGKLVLSEETRNIRAGFIMQDEDVEIDCAFETLVRLEREGLETQVANVLFKA